MKLLVFQIVFLAVVVAALSFPDPWRFDRETDSNEDRWRAQGTITEPRIKKDYTLGNNDDPNTWRNQRSLVFDRIPLFHSYLENKKKDKKPETEGSTINKWNEDDGIINCPPDVPKCIPRIGR